MKDTIGLNYRYPGVNPFSKEEKSIFFGRKKEVNRLLKRIELEELLVLFSKSGIGKSSLLEAGLVPKVEQNDTYKPIYIRFGAYQKGETLSPLEATFLAVKDENAKCQWLEDLVDGKESLWQLLKARQFQAEKSPKFLMVFDQFEELFSYPEEDVEAFKKGLSEVLYEEIPQAVRLKLNEQDNAITEAIPKNELDLLYRPFEKRLLLAIRSDRLSLLDEISDYIPSILKNRFELMPLTLAQASDAIKQPAKIVDPNFESEPFRYKKEALEKMLNLLSKNGTQPIESFQLQILCNNIERRMIANQLTEVSEEDIGDVEKIYENYYDNQIKSLEPEALHEPIRLILENEFIYEDEQRRLSLSVGQFKRSMDEQLAQEMPEDEVEKLLTQLVETRLVRREQSNRSQGSYLYELSHDTMVAPLLSAKSKRTLLEQRRQMAKERKDNLETQRKANRKMLWRVGIGFFVTVGALIIAFQMKERGNLKSINKELKEATIEANRLAEEANRLARESKILADTATSAQKRAIAKAEVLRKSTILALGLIPNQSFDTTQTSEELFIELQTKAENYKKGQKEYDDKLNRLIEELFKYNSERTRVKARQNLIREYSNDTLMITRLLNYSKDKMSSNTRYKNSLYQTLYILDNLSLQSLNAKKKEIELFFKAGEDVKPIGLWGKKSKQQIRSIRSKWRKFNQLVNR